VRAARLVKCGRRDSEYVNDTTKFNSARLAEICALSDQVTAFPYWPILNVGWKAKIDKVEKWTYLRYQGASPNAARRLHDAREKLFAGKSSDVRQVLPRGLPNRAGFGIMMGFAGFTSTLRKPPRDPSFGERKQPFTYPGHIFCHWGAVKITGSPEP
jgi:hypothetical protein